LDFFSDADLPSLSFLRLFFFSTDAGEPVAAAAAAVPLVELDFFGRSFFTFSTPASLVVVDDEAADDAGGPSLFDFCCDSVRISTPSGRTQSVSPGHARNSRTGSKI
jgi:hypothetical protein